MSYLYIIGGLLWLSYIADRNEEICDHNYEKLLPIEEGDAVLDVGSAVGCVTLLASKKASVVIAVEPNPQYFSSLEKRVLDSNINNVIFINKATWNEQGFKEFNIKGYSSSIVNMSTIVETDTIDNITSGLGINRIDFMKMDVEGAEIESLLGATNTLNNTRKIVVSAYHYRENDQKINEQTYIWVEKYLKSKEFNTITTEYKLVHGWK
jgi:FkbM family methyltransferase